VAALCRKFVCQSLQLKEQETKMVRSMFAAAGLAAFAVKAPFQAEALLRLQVWREESRG